ncbi:hypothetical protein ZWY2020_041161 [Hordeum vulgare]|nr:hypothetical protein ZWY2020_041161 [Hordeum vulgare]
MPPRAAQPRVPWHRGGKLRVGGQAAGELPPPHRYVEGGGEEGTRRRHRANTKEIYARLSRPVSFDDGTKEFWLEKIKGRGWTSDSDDNDKFEWDSDGEVEPSLTPAMRNFDAPGPSTLSSKGWINGEVPPTSLIEGFVAMGFPKEMVVRSIKEIGHSDADALLELLLMYKALGDDDAVGNHSTSGCNPPIVEDDNDLDFENWDGDYDVGGRESSSDDSGGEDFLRQMSEKDENIKSLRGMGFSEDEANMTILICGMYVDISVLVDAITASQVEEACHSRNLSDRQVTAGCFDSFGGRKRAILTEESKKKRKRYGGGAQGNRPSLDGSDEEPMPLPNPMIGFNLPAAKKRGYIHNLPTENRSPIFPLPPKTIFEAFPHYKKWAFGIAALDVKKLKDVDLYTIESVAYTPRKDILQIKGINEAKVDKIIEVGK